ncbi:MAG TPA: FkbM family methyltransferase [Stellaceae bacterium]|nr:FkbM family methyltransferase [Stellaceae bacterium]
MRVSYGAGATVTIDPTDYLGWAILRTGNYEPASLGLALRLMQATPGLFVDVGANFGWFSCAVAGIAGSTVIAVEADCANCAALRRNLTGFANAVVVNAAAGSRFDTLPIRRRAFTNSGTVAIEPADAASCRDWVAAVPLSDLLHRVGASPERPILVKIDVEGFEPQVLAGLDFAGPSRPRNIIMEYEPTLSAWESLVALDAFFAERGYDVLDVHGRPVAAAESIPEANIWAREH